MLLEVSGRYRKNNTIIRQFGLLAKIYRRLVLTDGHNLGPTKDSFIGISPK